jgi:hypothetical protein
VSDWEASEFLKELKKEWQLNERISDMAQKVWTSAKNLRGREFCSIFNELIRKDSELTDELAHQVATLAHAINSNVVTRGLGGDKPWPDGPAAGAYHNSTEPNTTWRGGGFSDRERAFFVVGKVYRAGGFLATSYNKQKAQDFIDRVRRAPLVLFESMACMLVLFESMACMRSARLPGGLRRSCQRLCSMEGRARR